MTDEPLDDDALDGLPPPGEGVVPVEPTPPPPPPAPPPPSSGRVDLPPPPTAEAPPAGPRGPRRWPRTIGTVAVALVIGVVLGGGAGVGATLLAGDGVTTVSADGVVAAEVAPDDADDPAPSAGLPAFAGDDGTPMTSFVTRCGRTLDVVPTEAVSTGQAIQVTLEVHPTCPEGELLRSAQLAIRLADVDGAPYAHGTFDVSDRPIYVPGYGERSTIVRASFGAGTAWSAPATLAAEIARGTVVVLCDAEDGVDGEEVSGAPPAGAGEVELTTGSEGDGPDPRATALAALRRQAQADDVSLRALEGSWVPQLSSKTDGTYDAFDDRTYDLPAIYQQYLSLRLEYPDVRLLYSDDWDAVEREDYWVVIAGVAFVQPEQANAWCAERGIDRTQCFAKRLVRRGITEETTAYR